jgi:cytochrome b6-f complex iron-sulfur subunit
MSGTAVLAVAIPTLVVLAGVLLYASAHRREVDRAIGHLGRDAVRSDRGSPGALVAAGSGVRRGAEVERAAARERAVAIERQPAELERPEPAWVPPDPESLGITRRQFFNRSVVALMGLGLSGFGAASLAFVWPRSGGGFGAEIEVGTLDDIFAAIDDGDGFAYYPEGRMWITRYPEDALPAAEAVYDQAALPALRAGFIALYQKCPHLGCRVPQCTTSQWFECPCHGSQYNRVGEKRGGPAPRGMDSFAVSVDGEAVTVDTGTILLGQPIGTNTTGQEAEGPHCVTAGGT